jgi:hypothetical protein
MNTEFSNAWRDLVQNRFPSFIFENISPDVLAVLSMSVDVRKMKNPPHSSYQSNRDLNYALFSAFHALETGRIMSSSDVSI